MFLVVMLYLLGVMVSAIASAYASPRWLPNVGPDGASAPSAVLVTVLLWPLLIAGAGQFFVSVALHRREVRDVIVSPFSHA